MMKHLLVLSLLFTSLGASAQTVHIKIIDGRTGKMLNGYARGFKLVILTISTFGR